MNQVWTELFDRIQDLQVRDGATADLVGRCELELIRAGLQPDGEILQNGLQLFKKLSRIPVSPDQERALIRILLRLGRLSDHLGEWMTARACFEQAVQLARKHHDRQLEAIAWMESGELNRRSGYLEQSMECHQNAIAAASAQNLLRERADAFNNMANTLTEMGRLDAALDAFSESLGIAETIHDARIEGHVYNNIGVVRCMQGRFRDALAEFARALAKRNQAKDRRGIAETYHNMSLAYKDLQEYEQAEKFVQNAVEQAGNLPHKGLLINIKITSLEIKILKNDLDFAYSLARNTLGSVEMLGDLHGKAEITRLLGLIHLRKNELLDAGYHLKIATGLFADLKIPTGEAESCELHAECLKRQDNFSAAAHELRRAEALYRRMGNIPTADRIQSSVQELEI